MSYTKSSTEVLSTSKGHVVAVAFFLLAVIFFEYRGGENAIDGWALDYEFSLLRKISAQDNDPGVAVVVVDEESLARSRLPLAVWHKNYGLIMQWLATLKPRVVGLDIVFPSHGYEPQFPNTDSVLLHGLYMLNEAGAKVVLAHSLDADNYPRPIYGPYLAMADVGSDVLIPDEDRIIRRHTEELGNNTVIPTFAGQIVRAAGSKYQPGMLNYRIKQNITYIPAYKLLHATKERQKIGSNLKGKIIIIGSALTDHDRLPQPFALHPKFLSERQPGVVLQANFVSNMLSNTMVKPVSKWVQTGIIITAVLVWWYSWRFSYAILALVGFLAIHMAGSMLGLYFGWYWPVVPVFIAAIGAFSLRLLYVFYQGKRELLIERSRIEAQRDFVYAISHDLETPVAGILASVGLIKTSTLSPSVERYLDYLVRSATVLKKEVKALLSLSRIEEGKYIPSLKRFDLFETVNEIYLALSPLAKQKGIGVSLSVSAEVYPFRIGAHTDLGRIVQNLLSNAIKYSDAGKIRIRLYPGKNRRRVRVELKDDGRGIPKGQEAQIFQKFEQLSRDNPGSGLGMNIVLKLVKLLDGEIGINSEENRGTTIWVEVPLELDDESREKFASLPTAIINKTHKEEFRPLFEQAGLAWNYTSLQTDGKTIRVIREEDLKNDEELLPFILLKKTEPPSWEKCVWTFGKGGVVGVNSPPQCLRRLFYLASLDQGANLDEKTENDIGIGKTGETRRGRRILLADDDEILCTVFCEILNNAGYEVIVAENGDKALQYARESEVDIIILDQHMPILEGSEVAQILRREGWVTDATPIFLMTAESNIMRMKRVDEGVRIIPKTTPPSDLLEMLDVEISARNR